MADTTTTDTSKPMAMIPTITIGFFADMESDAAKVFKKVAGANDAIFLFKKFDGGRNDMTEDLTNVEANGKYVATNALPLVVEFNHETAQKIFSGEIKSHLLMFVSKKSDEFKAQHETAQTIAKEYKGQLLFVTIGMFLVF